MNAVGLGIWLLLFAQEPVAPDSGAPPASGSDNTSAALPQDAGSGDELVQRPLESAPEVLPVLPLSPVFDRALTADELRAGLEALAAADPARARVETIGRSREGRSIDVLVLTDSRAGPAAGKPALLVFDHGSGATPGAEAALALAWRIVEEAQGDAEGARFLEDVAVYVAPALDPDRRSGGTPPAEEGTVSFELDFPLGWLPRGLRPGAGRTPLSRPETMAALRFLQARTNASLILGTAGDDVSRGAPFAGALRPERDGEVYEELALTGSASATSRLVPWTELGSPGGGFLDYAYQALGAYALGWTPPPSPPSANEREAWVDAAAERARLLARRLPRLVVEADVVERLAPGLWQLDLALRNEGDVPTLSALGMARGVAGAISIEVTGARLVAEATRVVAGEPYRVAGTESWDGILGPGETRWLRLLLETEEGAPLEVTGLALRAGAVRLSLEL